MANLAYETVAAGAAIAATWGNKVRDSVVNAFATTGARDSAITVPVDGMVVAITGSDALSYYDGAAWNQVGPLSGWTTWTPSVTQSATPAQSTSDSAYMRVGRLIVATATISFTGAGTASNAIECTWPVTPKSYTTNIAVGSFYFFDTGNTNRAGTVKFSSTAKLRFLYDGFGSDMGNGDFAIANGDALSLHIIYEAAA